MHYKWKYRSASQTINVKAELAIHFEIREYGNDAISIMSHHLTISDGTQFFLHYKCANALENLRCIQKKQHRDD